MKLDWTTGSLAEGLAHYNAGRFFAAHEAWESVWLASQEPEKTFLQALIQVAAAFHHHDRSNPLGTTLLLQAALQRLEAYPVSFGGICVSRLCDDIRDRLKLLAAGETVAELGSPRICSV
jgi:predicted metal-dependent hydrolase